jgi:hypothetical protein
VPASVALPLELELELDEPTVPPVPLLLLLLLALLPPPVPEDELLPQAAMPATVRVERNNMSSHFDCICKLLSKSPDEATKMRWLEPKPIHCPRGSAATADHYAR